MIAFIFWSFLLAIPGDCLKTNLALNKKAYLSTVFQYCYARYAVDGNINRDVYAHAGNQDDAWFVVDLGRPYQVEYVVLYHRSSCGYDCDRRMDYFIVGLSNNFDPQINKTIKRNDYKLCGQYNGKLNPGSVIDLQCQDKEAYSRYVIIQQDIGKKFLAIPELEVVGEYISYLGCFKTLINETMNEPPMINLTNCINICGNVDYMYAALQGTKCICGNKTKHYLPLSECNVTCSGGVDYCGGSNRLSVYEVFPLKFLKEIRHKYIGCFHDDMINRDLKFELQGVTAMTLDKCKNGCSRQNYLFFGVQSASLCFCGNNYGRIGKAPDNFCDQRCAGDQTCGGYLLNSIYSVYPEQGETNQHCKNGVDLDWNCINLQCIDGWTGEDCTERNCTTNRGDCGDNECRVMNGKTGVFSECICKEGFDKRSWWDYCYDIDECEDGIHMCNVTISNCSNTIGSYECKCNTGFWNYNQITCLDINECLNESRCNQSTSTCDNLIGSYKCTCKEGFTRDGLYSCRDLNECQEIHNACNLKVSNCTNTFGSYECHCLVEGLVYDQSNSNCHQSVSGSITSTRTIIIAVVCSILFTMILLGIILFIKFRKQLAKRFTIMSNLGSNNAVTQTAIESESQAIYLNDLKEYYEHNKNRLLSDFVKYPKVAETSSSYGKNAKLRLKNKFRNVIPFDYNRVVLDELPNEEFSDYINASFTPSFHETFQFIAAQGPIKETEYDFWRMILQYKVKVIVMLTNCVEKEKIKCLQYWSDCASKSVNDINVTLNDLKIWKTHEIRKLLITKDGRAFEVTHMLYKNWLDNQTPDNIGSLLNFHHTMTLLTISDSASPIVVHCSAGVGRTGTFLAMDFLLHEAQQTGKVDVFKCLKLLRAHRNHMIQTKVQFMFCFDVLNFYYELGNTTSIRLSDDVQQLLSERTEAIEKEYEWISRNISPNYQDPGNNKSRKISFEGCVQNSTYKIRIGCKISWQNIIQCCEEENNVIIIIDNLNEKQLDDFQDFNKNGNLVLTERLCHFQVKHIELTFPGFYNHVYANTDKIDLFAISSDTFGPLRHLWSAVKQLQVKDKSLLIFMNDLNKAGFVVCVLNLLEMMDAVEEIDVFQVVYQLKSLIPDFIDNKDEYQNLYSVVENCFKFKEHLYTNH